MNARWYRVCSGYAALLWLNLLFVIASLPLVTIPAALAALHDQTRVLADGTAKPTWRAFFSAMRRHGVAATAATLCLVAPTELLVLASRQTPYLTGPALVAIAVAGVLLPVAVIQVSLGAGGVRACLRRTLAAVVLRPFTVVLIALTWLGTAALVLLAPRVVALPLYLVAVSLPALVSTLLTRAPERDVEGLTPRGLAVRRVFAPEEMPAQVDQERPLQAHPVG